MADRITEYMDETEREEIIERYKALLEEYRSVEPRGLEEISNSGELGEILRAVAKPEQMKVLLLIYRGNDTGEIKEEVSVSESTVHNYLKDMENAGLVEREKTSQYSLTWKGEYVLAMLENLSTMLRAEQFDRMYTLEDFQKMLDISDGPSEKDDDWSPDDLQL